MPAAAWLALAALAASSAAPTAAAAAPSPPVRVWVDAYGFAPGETLPLRDAVLVRERERERRSSVWLGACVGGAF